MRKVLLLLVMVFAVAMLWAQTPQKMTYQAVVRNANNSLVVNQNVRVRISILQGSESGSPCLCRDSRTEHQCQWPDDGGSR